MSHFDPIIREWTIAGKQKHGGVRAKGSGGMRFFHPSTLLCKKYWDAGFVWDQSKNLTRTGDQRWVSGYKYTHPDFPVTIFQVAKKNCWYQRMVKCHLIMRLCNILLFFFFLQVKQQLWQQQQQVKMYWSIKLFRINWKFESFPKQHHFDNCLQQWKKSSRSWCKWIVCFGPWGWKWGPSAWESAIYWHNNCTAGEVGKWITPTICPCAQENCCNTNGKFSTKSWELQKQMSWNFLTWGLIYYFF